MSGTYAGLNGRVDPADPAYNAGVVQRVLSGQRGPHRDIVLLNAAAGLVIAGVADSIEHGLVTAAESIDGGHAAITLQRFIDISQDAAASST